ncbi:MAG: DUF4880 domain-containing protein [Gammaproteobacteria bacterium]
MNSDPREEDWPDADADLTALEGEAIEWVVRLTSGKATACDRAKFERWRAQSPQHEAAAQSARDLWVGMGHALSETQASSAQPQRSRFAAMTSRRWVALAASLILGVFLGFQGLTTGATISCRRPGNRSGFRFPMAPRSC